MANISGQPSEADWAWLAGLFEGEGHIGFLNGPSSRTVRATITMTDLDVLERVDFLFPSPNGIGTWQPKSSTGSPRKRVYCWRICRSESIKAFLEGIRPWALERRTARIDEALERIEQIRGRPNAAHPRRRIDLQELAKTG